MFNKYFSTIKSAITARLFLYGLLSVLMLSGPVACIKDRALPDGPPTNANIALDKQSANLMIGDVTDIAIQADNGKSYVKAFDYSSSDPRIASVERKSAYVVTVTAKRKGTATIQFVAKDGETLKATINVDEPAPDGTIRILAIGNSFSEDAIETYLYPIAAAGGDSIVIGNLYIGGASLEDHLNNAKENKAVYSFRKINKQGVKSTRDNISIEQALDEERWDFISFQQASPLSGQYATYEASLPALVQYVKDRVTYSRTKYVWHQTWAYQQNSTYPPFANYNSNQLTMYNAIMDASQKAATLMGADIVVPSGTAIQNGRSSFWGDNFCRDGYHLDLNLGRYLAACTWYEALFNKSVVGNSYNPFSYLLSAEERALAQQAAHEAVLKKYAVTDLTAFKQFPAPDLAAPVFLDVAQQVPAFGWNGLSSRDAGANIVYLRNKEGKVTPAGLTLTEGFNNMNTNGELNTTTSFDMPNSVSQNSYFGNTKQNFDRGLFLKSVLKISRLNPAKMYNLCFFGSRGGTAETRQTKYISKGQNEVSASLNTGSNKSNIACTDGIKPDADGNIFVTITAGDANDSPVGFYYLNAMRIQQQ